jgi:hypothetical protein
LIIKELAEEDLGDFDSLDEFWFALKDTLEISQVYDIHQKSKIELTYPKGQNRNSLLVGGLTLSRGYTVEGLITSVFIRTTRTFDALMQMGRWFGHKKHIAQYISVHTIEAIRNRFDIIEDSIVDLLEQIKEMKEARQAPKDFGLNIKRHPNVAIDRAVSTLIRGQGLEVVARNKQKAASLIELKLSLSNRCMETVRLLPDPQVIQSNHEGVVKFWNQMLQSHLAIPYSESAFPGMFLDGAKADSSLGFIDVPHELVRDFILNFQVPKQTLSDTTSKLPLRFLEEFLKDHSRSGMKWDVGVVTSSRAAQHDVFDFCGHEIGKVTRSFERARDGESIKIPKNQLSIPSNEYRFLPEAELTGLTSKMNRSEARGIRKANGNRPLLLLYPISPGVAKGVDDLDLTAFQGLHLWGWTISMPGTKEDEERVVVLANTVYRREIEELLEIDYDTDDEGDD